MTTGGVAERVARVEETIARACERAGRARQEVRLVAVTKQQSLARIRAAHAAGLRVFGENRVQEAEEKRPELPDDVEWHLVGPLQSNKVRRAVDTFRVVHAVDRPKIAILLDREAGERGLRLDGFLEVNLGEEPAKHGFSPRGFLDTVAPLADLGHLRLVGLMAIPPLENDPERTRLWFRRLRDLRDRLVEHPAWAGCPGRLSMGMSDDFDLAIAEGATDVRVGTALFGPREG
jgi:hypothetical protein